MVILYRIIVVINVRIKVLESILYLYSLYMIPLTIRMESTSNVDRLLRKAHSVSMLIYIYEHPYCKRSDIYQQITRNAHTPEKLDYLASKGLIAQESFGRMTVMSLTEKGEELVSHILRMEELLSDNDSEIQDSGF